MKKMEIILALCIDFVLCGAIAYPQNDSSGTVLKGPKRPPTSLKVFSVNSTTVHVKWNSVADTEGEEPIKGYKIRIWDESEDGSPVKETIVSGAEKSETIIDALKPEYLYKMRVLAYSESGDGRMSSPPIRFQTTKD